MIDELGISVVANTLRNWGVEQPMLQAIATMILAHAKRVSAPATTTIPAPKRIDEIARLFHASSLRRQDFVGKGADDTGWNMMLAIFADQTAGKSTSVSSACYASGSPATTALRCLSQLQRRGIVLRTEDPRDHRRVNVTLTAEAHARMAALITSFCVEPPALAATPGTG